MARKARLPRIERTEEFHVEDETAHLWAVSYADFLMVLLSFFILFFSTDSSDKNDIIERVTKGTQSLASGGAASGLSDRKGGGGVEEVDPDTLSQVLQKHNVSVVKMNRKVIFNFGENIYPVGKFNVNAAVEKDLQAVLELLKPYMDLIDLTLVGHTDNLKMKHIEGRFLKNNFDLSVLRATRALEAALKMGVAPEALAAKGSAGFQRNTRSLSLIVSSRGNDH